MVNVLFVCTGNIFRSLSAERLLKKHFSDIGEERFTVRSAGISCRPQEPRQAMVKALANYDINVEAHQQHVVSQEHIDWADTILAMGFNHKEFIKNNFHTYAHLYDQFALGQKTAEIDVEEALSPEDRTPENINAYVQSMVSHLHSITPKLAEQLQTRHFLFEDFVLGKRTEHVNGVPFNPLLENEHAMAFHSIDLPGADHVLVIPKQRIPDYKDIPQSIKADMDELVSRIGEALEENNAGYNILLNNGRAAGQYIYHAHIHVVARNPDDGIKIEEWLHHQATPAEYKEYDAHLRTKLVAQKQHAQAFNVLFVCTGNIFRSFSAERLLKKYFQDQNEDRFCVKSVGTVADPDPMDEVTQETLTHYGADISNHVQTRIDHGHLRWADIIICMSDYHQDYINKHMLTHEHVVLYNELAINEHSSVDDVQDIYAPEQRTDQREREHMKHTIEYLHDTMPAVAHKLQEKVSKRFSGDTPLKGSKEHTSIMTHVAINGFGRIGRMVFRAGMHDEDIEFVAINDLTDTKTLAYLLKYDSVHGKLDDEISYDDHGILVNGKHIPVYAQRDPADLPWGEHDVEIVAECTGFFRTEEAARKHLDAGAQKVVISAPAKGGDVKTIVKGINEHEIQSEHCIISNASCTTNCLGHLVKVLHDNFGVESGFFNTIHSFTGDQNHVDGPHKDLRRGRACANNIVPTTSGAAVAVTQALPELEGKITGMATRVPTPDGSVTDFICTVKKETSVEEINELFKNVAQHHLKGVLEYTEDEIVSSDIIGNPHSCIFDAAQTQVIDGNKVRVFGWYDNEWGYSCRMIDIIKHL